MSQTPDGVVDAHLWDASAVCGFVESVRTVLVAVRDEGGAGSIFYVGMVPEVLRLLIRILNLALEWVPNVEFISMKLQSRFRKICFNFL